MKPLELTPIERHALTQALGRLMSDWSEETHAAGWLVNLENDLPDDCTRIERGDAPRHYPHGFTPYEATMFVTLAQILGHWAMHEGDGYIPYHWSER